MPDTARPSLSATHRLYLCTDARTRQGDLPEFLDAVLAGGVDIVQLRDKGMEAAEELEHLGVFADACARHGKLLAVNDRADVAHAAGADVLHLGQGDLPVPAARAILGDGVLVGRSTHSAAEAEAAAVQERRGLLLHRPLLAHPHQARPPRPRPRPGAVTRPSLGADRPWFAIGGIDLGNLDEVLDGGRPPGRRGPRDHRGGRPGRRGGGVRQAAQRGVARPSRHPVHRSPGCPVHRSAGRLGLRPCRPRTIVQGVDNNPTIRANFPHPVG